VSLFIAQNEAVSFLNTLFFVDTKYVFIWPNCERYQRLD